MKKSNTLKKVFYDIFSIMPISIIIVSIFSLLISLIVIYQIELFTKIIDSANMFYNTKQMPNDIIILISLYVLGFIMTIIMEKINERILKINLLYKDEIFHKRLANFLVTLSLEACDNPKIKNDFWKAKDAVYQSRMLNVVNITFNFFILILKIIGITLILSRYDYNLVLLSVLSIIPAIIVKIIGNKKLFKLRNTQISSLRQRNYFSSLLTDRNYVKEIRMLNCENFLIDKNFHYNSKLYYETQRVLQPLRFQISLCEIIKISAYGISIFLSILLYQNNQISIGALSTCFIAFQTMQTYSQSLISNFVNLNDNIKYANDYYVFMEYKNTKEKNYFKFSFNNFIELKDVYFKYYNKTEFALKGINLRIQKGKKIAIVGENGSGKSTLVKVILGLYEPENGEILYDDLVINNFEKNDLYNITSLVSQDFMRYSLKLRENIGISNYKSLINDKLIIDAISKINFLNILEKVSLDDELGLEYGGKEVSGGEWQKIALSRAIFKDYELITLDEPTSSLDPNSEYNILTKFLEIIKEKTSLIISNRIGLCPLMDEIIVLDKGIIVEKGKHNDLLNKKGKYYELWNSQAKWYYK